MEFKPHAYQEYAIKRVVEQEKVGLFLDMGLGKTSVTLTAIAQLLDDFEVGKVLVIAPLNVAKTVWSEEAAKWDHTKHLRVSKVLGPNEQMRMEGLQQTADIYVINRENVAWLVGKLGRKWPFDMVVIDELSSFKNQKSERFKALRRVLPRVRRLVGLTGTPTPNGLIDLWSQIYLLDKGEHLGRTLTAYRNTFFEPGKRNGQIIYEWKLRPFAEEEIYKRLESLCMSMKTANHLDMPECVYNVVPVQLSAETIWYRQMKREQVIELKGKDITAANAAAMTGKLLQVTGGAVYDDEHGVEICGRMKLDALEEIIESAQGKPVLVFYQFRHELPRLLERFPQAVALKDAKDVERWNEGRIPVLLAHPASAGHGLNLQQGGHIAVWYTLTWNLEHYQQANKRLHRQGQKNTVIIHHLVAKDTIDEQIMRVLEGKASIQDAVMEAFECETES